MYTHTLDTRTRIHTQHDTHSPNKPGHRQLPPVRAPDHATEINTFLAGYTSKTGHVSRLRAAFRTMLEQCRARVPTLARPSCAPAAPHPHVICGAAHHAQLPCHALHYRHAKQREQSVHPWAQAHAERCTGFRWSSIRTQTCAHTATIMRACKPNVQLLATASTMRRDAALCAAICRK